MHVVTVDGRRVTAAFLPNWLPGTVASGALNLIHHDAEHRDEIKLLEVPLQNQTCHPELVSGSMFMCFKVI